MTCRSFEGQGRRGRGGGKREGEGERKGGREHITRRGGEARDLGREREREGENVMWPAVRPDYSPSPSLSRAVYVGRQEWRQEAASSPSPSSLPFLPSSFSSLTHLKLFTHSVTHSTAPVAPPTNFSYLFLHLPSPGPACFCCAALAKKKNKKKKERKRFPSNCIHQPPAPPVFCLSVSIARGGCPPVHHNSLGAEVRRGVLRCE